MPARAFISLCLAPTYCCCVRPLEGLVDVFGDVLWYYFSSNFHRISLQSTFSLCASNWFQLPRMLVVWLELTEVLCKIGLQLT